MKKTMVWAALVGLGAVGTADASMHQLFKRLPGPARCAVVAKPACLPLPCELRERCKPWPLPRPGEFEFPRLPF